MFCNIIRCNSIKFAEIGKDTTMTKASKKAISFVLSLFSLFGVFAFSAENSSAEALTLSVDNYKIGLYYGSSALPGANLENEVGSGYEFGYYDSRRNFVSIGASTDERKISMIADYNMYYNSSTGNYAILGSGSADVVVGCFHIQLETAYSSYSEARSKADTFTSVNAFPKYENGSFYVCAGAYTSRAEAEAAAETLSLNQGYSISSGTSNTVAVVITGTDEIILEFDCGTSKYLGVKPKGTNTQTWFKSNCYFGMFEYRRGSNGNLTVINVVDIESYVKCVITYEMSASWPLEALKAQAICARSYLVTNLASSSKHSSYGFDLCNTADCQVYRGTARCTSNSNRAVDETKGMFLTYNGSICTTYYCSSDGGATENTENVWSATIAYLKGKVDPYETAIADSIPGYYYTKTYTGAELTELLQSKNYPCSNIVNCEVTKLTDVGNVYTVTFTDDRGKTYSFSKSNAKAVFGLSSQRFTITSEGGSDGKIYVDDSYIESFDDAYAIGDGGSDKIADSENVYAITDSGTEKISESGVSSGNGADTVYTISGSGNGHHIGMSQYGAYSMAKYYDKTYKDILAFYFEGTEITTIS